MRYLARAAFCAALAGCATAEQLDAKDYASCERTGAQPGTDLFVTCMIALRRDRPHWSVTVGAQNSDHNSRSRSMAGLDSYTGQSCIGQSVPNPYGPPKFVCN